MDHLFAKPLIVPDLFNKNSWELLHDFSYKEENSPKLSRDSSEIPDLESLHFSKTSDLNYCFNKKQFRISQVSVNSDITETEDYEPERKKTLSPEKKS